MTNHNYDAQVICPVPFAPFPLPLLRNKWKIYAEVEPYGMIDGVKVYYPRYVEFPGFLAYFGAEHRMNQSIKRCFQKNTYKYDFDLIHSHYAFPDGYAALMLSKRSHKPYVVTCRGSDLDITAKRNNILYDRILITVSNAERVIVPSPRLADTFYELFQFYPTVISNGIFTSNIYLDTSPLGAEYSGRRVLLSASQLIPSKGIDFNIRAVKRLLEQYPNIIYLVIGDGPERTNLEKLVLEMGLTSHIKFLGALPHQIVMQYMSFCDIFSVPSWQETFGLVYTEAMAHGVPVIGVEGQGIAGVVQHGTNGMLVKSRDIDSLVNALTYLLAHPEKARAMGKQARELVVREYTWECNAIKHKELYEEILNS